MRAPPIALLALVAWGCVPGLGPFVLEPVEGRVVDQDSGRPIAEAEVLQWWRGGGVPGGSQPEYHARWTRSDAEGSFAFGRGLAPSPRMWLLKTYGPTFSFYHPRYGLVHAGAGAAAGEPAAGAAPRVILRGSLRQARQRLEDLAAWCRAGHAGDGARHLAAVACPARAAERAGE